MPKFNAEQLTCHDNVIYPDDLSWGPHGNYLTISFNYMLYHGDYIVILKNIKDNSLNKNLMPETVMSFRINDVIPIDPTRVSILGVDGDNESREDVIYIIYPEKMDPIYVLEASNYSLKSPGSENFAQLDDLAEEPSLMLFGISRNTVVKIVIPGGSNQTVVGATLRIQNAIDYAGNNVDAPFVVTVVPLRTPKVTSVYQTDSNKLTFVFDEELFEVLTDAFNIVIDNGTTVDHFTPGGLSFICKDGKTTVDVVLGESCIQTLKGINQDYGKDSSLMLTDISGVRLKLVGRHIESIYGKKPRIVKILV